MRLISEMTLIGAFSHGGEGRLASEIYNKDTFFYLVRTQNRLSLCALNRLMCFDRIRKRQQIPFSPVLLLSIINQPTFYD